MRQILVSLALGGLLLSTVALTAAPAYADDDVAALVVDNGNSRSVPEPSSLALFGVGLTGLVALRLKKRKDGARKPRADQG